MIITRVSILYAYSHWSSLAASLLNPLNCVQRNALHLTYNFQYRILVVAAVVVLSLHGTVNKTNKYKGYSIQISLISIDHIHHNVDKISKHKRFMPLHINPYDAKGLGYRLYATFHKLQREVGHSFCSFLKS